MKEPIFLPLHRLRKIEPEPAVFERIMHGIHRAKLFQLRVRFALIASGLCISVGSVVLTWSSIWQEFSTSSFFEFVRFVISDPDIVRSDIRGFVSGLLETLPVTVLLFVCVGFFFLLAGTALVQAWRKSMNIYA